MMTAKYNKHLDSIDVVTSAGYMLRINCRKAEKGLKTTFVSDEALVRLAVEKPFVYALLYLNRKMQSWLDIVDSLGVLLW